MMYFIHSWILVYLYCSTLISAGQTPTISVISAEQIKDIGSTLELECTVKNAQDYPVVWIKLDKKNEQHSLFISSGSSLLVKDSRFNIRHDLSTNLYTLQINNTKESDAGMYQCQIVIGANNRITANVDVLIRIPPVILDNSTRSLIVTEGKDIALECYASGFPNPNISWRRENNAILPVGGAIYRGNILQIPSIKSGDSGTYYCVAENNVGKGVRRSITVEIEFTPKITVPVLKVGQALNFDMDLECHISAYPLPSILWLKDNITLTNNQHYRITHFTTSDKTTETTLRVITIEKEQYGSYTCKATNKLGFSEAEIELQETTDPICPPACGHKFHPAPTNESVAANVSKLSLSPSA